MAKSNPMKIIGIGCGVLIFLGILVAGVIVFMGYQVSKEVEEQSKNPQPNAERILGTTELPEGYLAHKAFTVSYVMDIVMLSDQPLNADGEPELGVGSGFFYTQFRFMKEKSSDELDAFFRGESENANVLAENHINIRFETDEIRGRGIFEYNGMNIRYVSTHGVHTDKFSSSGLTTVILFGCPDGKARYGLWYSENDGGDGDLAGTVADEDKIKDFIKNFQLCGSGEK